MMLAPQMPAALTEKETASLGKDGYLLRETLLSSEECEKLAVACELAVKAVLADTRSLKVQSGAYTHEHRPRLRTLIKWEPKAPNLIQGIEPCAHLNRTIAAFGADERLLAPCRVISGHDDIIPLTEKLNLKRAGNGGAFALHQDQPYWALACLNADSVATAMVCLDDSTKGSGCLEIAPGSHRDGVQPRKSAPGAALEMDPRAFDAQRLMPIEAPAGSVIFFGAFLVHRSGPNVSGKDRRALLYSYQPSGGRHLRELLNG